MEDKEYEALRKRYPQYVSKEQLFIICRISKRSAKYLLDNGIIPCEDTGKKTWRYKVALEDIITYLKRRDETGDTQIPYGGAGSGRKKIKALFPKAIIHGREDEVRRYFEYIFDDFPDVLNMYDAAEMTGLALSTINRLVKAGAINSIRVDRRPLIPKAYMLDFVTSPRYLNTRSDSTDFYRVTGGFSLWKMQK